MLKVENLSIFLKDKKREIVKKINFSIEPGECLAILGESGSGKSLTCKAILGLLDENKFFLTGQCIYNNENLLKINKDKMRVIRGKKIAMILQNPMTAFDPLYTIGYQIKETFREHLNLNKKELEEKALILLKKVCIKDESEVLKKYPHELSGGMLQRIMIGLALFLEPDIIIADEPTTALDTITQYEIIEEFLKIKREKNIGMIFVTHDIGVASKISDKILVIENGEKKFEGNLKKLLESKEKMEIVQKKLILLDRYKEILGEKND